MMDWITVLIGMASASDLPNLPRKFKGPKKAVHLIMPESLVKAIDAVAERHGLSRTELIIHGLAWVVDRMNAADAEPGDDS